MVLDFQLGKVSTIASGIGFPIISDAQPLFLVRHVLQSDRILVLFSCMDFPLRPRAIPAISMNRLTAIGIEPQILASIVDLHADNHSGHNEVSPRLGKFIVFLYLLVSTKHVALSEEVTNLCSNLNS